MSAGVCCCDILADPIQFVLKKVVQLLLLELSSKLVLAGCLCHFQLLVLMLTELSLLCFLLELVLESLNLPSDFSNIPYLR